MACANYVSSYLDLIETISTRVLWLDRRRRLNNEALRDFIARDLSAETEGLIELHRRGYELTMEGFEKLYTDIYEAACNDPESKDSLGPYTRTLVDKVRARTLNIHADLREASIDSLLFLPPPPQLQTFSAAPITLPGAPRQSTFTSQHRRTVAPQVPIRTVESALIDLEEPTHGVERHGGTGSPSVVTQKGAGRLVSHTLVDEASRSSSRSSSTTELTEYTAFRRTYLDTAGPAAKVNIATDNENEVGETNARNYPPINIRPTYTATSMPRLIGSTPARPTALWSPGQFDQLMKGPRVPTGQASHPQIAQFMRQDSNYSLALPVREASRPITPAEPGYIGRWNGGEMPGHSRYRHEWSAQSRQYQGHAEPISMPRLWQEGPTLQAPQGPNTDETLEQRLAELSIQQANARRCVRKKRNDWSS